MNPADPITKASVERTVETEEGPSETTLTITLHITLTLPNGSWIAALLKDKEVPTELAVTALSNMYNLNTL